jgi:hypothetical protein
MKVEDLEPEMDELLKRLIPDLMNWRGATADEIKKIELIVKRVSGNELPKFYRWFLMRMGQSMGNFSYHGMDYSAGKVISWYDNNWEDDGTKFFKIGHNSNLQAELHMYYDFNCPVRDDACVTMREAEGGEDYKQFETFREMLSTKAAHINAVRYPVFCTGTLLDDSDILPQLDPLMESLGFIKPAIPTGPRCALYEGSLSTLVTTGSMEFGIESCSFVLGGDDINKIRNVLGVIETETEFAVNVKNDPRQIRDS